MSVTWNLETCRAGSRVGLSRSLWHLFNVYIAEYHLGATKLTIAGGVPGLVPIYGDRNEGMLGRKAQMASAMAFLLHACFKVVALWMVALEPEGRVVCPAV